MFMLVFQMCPQSTCLRRCKITLVAFVWLFSIVHFQMSPQIACLRTGKVTLVAFFWFFSFVHLKMTPKAAFCRGYIFTFVALVWIFIAYVIQGNVFIIPTFIKVIIYNMILIHHHNVGNVVPCVVSISNWQKWGFRMRKNESGRGMSMSILYYKKGKIQYPTVYPIPSQGWWWWW